MERAELSLEMLVKIMITVVILVFFFYVGYKIYQSFFGEQVDMDTKNSFTELGQSIESMLNRPNVYEYRNALFQLDTKSIIASYASIDTKPVECEGKSCLCIYPSSESEDDWKPDNCISFSKSIAGFYMIFGDGYEYLGAPYPKIDAQMYPSELQATVYKNLYLKDPASLLRENKDLEYLSKRPRVYIEKMESKASTHILLGWGLSDDQIDARKKALMPCSPESDPECVNVIPNTMIGTGFCVLEDVKCVYKTGLTECPTSELLDTECICGDKLGRKGTYCNYHVDGGITEKFVLPINCAKIKACIDYCESLSKSYLRSECEGDERNFCQNDVCRLGLGCESIRTVINVGLGVRCQEKNDGVTII